MPIIYRTPFVQFHHDPVGATFEIEWLDFANSEQLRATLNEALRLARQHGVRGWIGNNVRLRTIRPVDQEWIVQHWFADFARLGIRRLATVVSKDALAQMGVTNILQQATEHAPYDTQHFDDILAARRWAASTTD